MSIPWFPVYLFDLDGTLVDSWRDITGAIRSVIAETPQSGDPVTDEFLRAYIGRHLIDLFLDLGYEREQIDPMVVNYRHIYAARHHANTVRYPGVKEGLAALGGRKSTATTKGTPMTRVVLEKYELLEYFDHVQGTDGFPAKPEPDVVLASLRIFDVDPKDVLFVGDAPADMEAGRRAGVKTCAVRYGYGTEADLAKWEPDYWIDDLRELSASAR